MVRRLVLFLTTLGLSAGSTLLLPASAPAAPTAGFVRVSEAFSPNDDGRRDEAVVRVELIEAVHVSLVVSSYDDNDNLIARRRVEFKQQAAGVHFWRWDGRDDAGTRLPEGYYSVEMVMTKADGGRETKSDATRIDTSLAVSVRPSEDYGQFIDPPHTVYPRTDVVRDVFPLRPSIAEDVQWATLLIKDSSGRTVLSRDVAKWRNTRSSDDVNWTARLNGEPLPPGRYRARIRARDLIGTVGRSDAFRLRVSGKALKWRKVTRLVSPAATATYRSCGPCVDERPEPCGTVAPSALYPGGLSYRSGECASASAGGIQVAGKPHHLPVPSAVRGVAAARVAFTGRPTVGGEGDTGTLRMYAADGQLSKVTSSTGGQTEWIRWPELSRGDVELDRVPGVMWDFATNGTDSVDVDRFTVTMRYLAVAK